MNERDAKSRDADAQMSEALARWERDGGALRAELRATTDDRAGHPREEAVFAEAAAKQGFKLECCKNPLAGTVYRLSSSGSVHTPPEFKLSLEDVETILMNRNPS